MGWKALVTRGRASSNFMDCSIKATRGNQLWPMKKQSYMWLQVFHSDRQFWKASLGPNTSQCFLCTAIVSCLTFATRGKDVPLHTLGISLQSEVLGHMGTVLQKHKPQMFCHCTGCHPCCPILLLCMSCDFSVTPGEGEIASTSFCFLALPYLHSSSSKCFHG